VRGAPDAPAPGRGAARPGGPHLRGGRARGAARARRQHRAARGRGRRAVLPHPARPSRPVDAAAHVHGVPLAARRRTDPRCHRAPPRAGAPGRRHQDPGRGDRRRGGLRAGGRRLARPVDQAPRRAAPGRDVLRADPGPDHHQRAGVPAPGAADVRRRAGLARRRHRAAPRGPGRRLHAGAGRGVVAAALQRHVQRDVELPRRPLRGGQPGPLAARLTGMERRRSLGARLPAPRRQPRDRALAGPRPRRVPRPRPARAGDDAAVQGHGRVPVQPVAASGGAV
ncbi:MAG: hypothetical protein AVDCRST_MAG06-1862, partial [uncultured Nocardioides sp.]